jgi:formylmethanofuran--tetrahydromethanopterin N-formyltransferase
MEGECLLQDSFGVEKHGIGGGNFLILAEDADSALTAAEAAVAAIDDITGVILPFPGGIARNGTKVGSRAYTSLVASTSDAYCPTLRLTTASALPEGVNSVLELVLDGLNAERICRAMRAGIDAACRPGVRAITAGNYGGNLGPHRFPLRSIMTGSDAI